MLGGALAPSAYPSFRHRLKQLRERIGADPQPFTSLPVTLGNLRLAREIRALEARLIEHGHAIADALAGSLSIPKAAEQFRLPVDDVRKILKDEIARCRDGERLRQTWMLADRRLAAAELRFYKKAMEEGDCASAVVFVKISERRATLNGANMPQSHVLQVVSAPQPTQTSTERIRDPWHRCA